MDSSRSDTEDEEESRSYPLQFIHRDGLRDIPTPLARITTCGMLQVEVLKEVVSVNPPLGRYVVLSMQTLRGRGAVPSLMLLKLLASSPRRFSTKDMLTTQMQQEMEKGTAIRLDTYASYLRGSLCQLDASPALIDPLRLLAVEYLRNGRGSGPGYRLGPYPLLWLDTQALTYQVEYGVLMERMGEPTLALPFWQRAYQLASKGEYLPDDPHSDWAQSTREQVAGHLKQSVHTLRRLLLAERGASAKEEVMLLLRSYWLTHKTDEDALRPLMELLGEQERFGEAQEYYLQCVEALNQVEVGRQPTQQTRDLHKFLRIKHIRREHSERVSSEDGVSLTVPTRPLIAWPSSLSGPYTATQGIREAVGESGGQVTDLSRRLLLEQFLGLILAKTPTALSAEALLKPDLLENLLGASKQHVRVDELVIPAEEMVPLYAVTIPACWNLYFAGKRAEVESALPASLSHLPMIVQQSSTYRSVAARLASQAYQLDWLLALQRQNFGKALSSIKQAFHYADLAGENNLRVSSLIRQAHIYFHLKSPFQQFQLHQKATQYGEGLSPLIQGWFSIVLAESYAYLGDEAEADRLLGVAHTVFPDHPEYDPNFVNTPINHYTLANHEVILHLRLRRPKRAWKILEEIDKTLPSTATPRRAELFNRQTQALLALGEMHQACSCFEAAVSVAQTLNSPLRYQESCENYEQMRQKWPTEGKVKAVGKLLQQDK
jgi:tetratricopeptide (TPR) repeat protein